MISILSITVAILINVAVLWFSFVHGLHHNLAISIMLAGGVSGILFAAHPALLRLPTWAMLVVWAILVIALYVAPPPLPQDDILDQFFGGES
jgi:hypothetical protein